MILHKRAWSMWSQYTKNVFIGVDQLLNAIIGGDPDETISSRLGKAHRGQYGRLLYWGTYVFWLITNIIWFPWDGWGHCEQSIEEDEGEDDLLHNKKYL
jgi:hypothetical protein